MSSNLASQHCDIEAGIIIMKGDFMTILSPSKVDYLVKGDLNVKRRKITSSLIHILI